MQSQNKANASSKSKQEYLSWFNGKLVKENELSISVRSHGLHYGSSAFEGIRSYSTKQGPVFFRLEDHISRLRDSATIYGWEIPFSNSDIVEGCKSIVRKNNLENSYIRPLAYIGDVGLGLRPNDVTCDLAILATQVQSTENNPRLKNGVHVGISSWNRLALNTLPTGAKAGGNYLSSQLISREAQSHGYDEAIALDTNGYVSEGSGENVFIVKNNTLFTPPIYSSILPGITRDTIMILAEEIGINVVEQNITRESLYLAEEIFLCGTSTEIVHVKSVDGRTIGSGTEGPLTSKIKRLFFGLFIGTVEDKWGWIETV